MTEKEEKASEKILKAIADLELKMLHNYVPTVRPSEKESMDTQGHKTIEEMLECPNCYPKIKDGVVKKEGFIKPIGKRNSKEYPYICEGCGLNVKKEEKECPNCGGTKI